VTVTTRPKSAKPRKPKVRIPVVSEVMDLNEFAAIIGSPYQTAWSIAKTGAIPIVRLPSRRSKTGVSRRLLFRRSDVARLLNAWREQSA